VGPDDNIQGAHTDIRPREELANWLQKDPIKRFEDYLLRHGLMDQEGIEDIGRKAQLEVEQAHSFAKESIFPQRKDLAKYVFKENTPI
jgi:pyruvate dehydrogenase E1 component alpha subunit